MEYNREEYGKRVKAIRESHHLTMKDFGEAIGGANRSIINNIEKGLRPASKWMEAIAELGNTSVILLKYGSYDVFVDLLMTHYVLEGKSFHYTSELIEWAESNQPSDDIDLLAKAVQLQPNAFIQPLKSGQTQEQLIEFAQPLSQLYKLSVNHFPNPDELNRYLSFVSQWISLPVFEKKAYTLIQDQISRLSESDFYHKTEVEVDKEFLNIKLNLLNILDGLYTQKRLEHQQTNEKDDDL